MIPRTPNSTPTYTPFPYTTPFHAWPGRARQDKLMETRSNNGLVGAFVLFFTLAIAIFVVWMANDSGGAKREYDIFFKQSVDGLNKGSQVQFSGEIGRAHV